MALSRTDRLKQVDRRLAPIGVGAGRGIAAATGRRAPATVPLVVRPGGMGDLIALQIACEDLGLDPRDRLWLVERRSAAWARRHDLPHESFDEHPARALRRIAGRHAVVLNTEQRFGLAHAAAAASRARRGRTFAFATNLAAASADVQVPYDPLREHETVAFARMLAAAHELAAPDHATPRARHQPDAGHVVAAVSGLQSVTRALPVETFAAVVAAAAGERPVLVTAAPIDRAYAARLLPLLPTGATVLDAGFDAVCDAIASAHRIVAVDGGPVHIASYAGVAATAIFTSGRHEKWAPLGAGSVIVRRRDLDCQPCTLFGQTPPCPNGLACLTIDPQEALPVSPGSTTSR